jgi:hypothetical protein
MLSSQREFCLWSHFFSRVSFLQVHRIFFPFLLLGKPLSIVFLILWFLVVVSIFFSPNLIFTRKTHLHLFPVHRNTSLAQSTTHSACAPTRSRGALHAHGKVFEDHIYRLPPHLPASHPLLPGLFVLGLPLWHPEFINTPPGLAQGHNFNPGQSQSYSTMAPPGQQAFNQLLLPVQPFPGSGQQGSFSGGAHGQGHASGSSRGPGPFSGGIAPLQTQTQCQPPP